MTYKITTLANGLRVASELLPGIESATIAASVNVGSSFEDELTGGISHVLEHMAFKGTTSRNAFEIAEQMDNVGGNMNAYTSIESTVYYAKVLKEDVALAVDIIGDILQNSTFDEQELTREKEVILQEIAMHYDTPDDLIFDYFGETAYPDQPLGRSILGTPELVNSYNPDNLNDYIAKHYKAGNMVVSAAGNIDHDQFVSLVEKHFGGLAPSAPSVATKAQYHGGEKRVKRKLEQLHLMLGFEAVSFSHPDYYIWQVLATLLGGGMSSRLFREVREKRGLAYTVQAFVSAYRDSGIFGIYTATGEEKAPEMLKVVCGELQKLLKGIDASELLRAKNQIKASLLMSRESSSGVADWIGRHLICYDRYKPAREISSIIDAISEEDIIRISKQLLSDPKLTFTTLGPQKKLPDYAKLSDMIKQSA
ncbi:MAG: pitrilysin family protein [Pseudomonadota bacterium]